MQFGKERKGKEGEREREEERKTLDEERRSLSFSSQVMGKIMREKGLLNETLVNHPKDDGSPLLLLFSC